MKSSSVLVLVLSFFLGAAPAYARHAPSHHRKHHKITRVHFREVPRHHAAHREAPRPRLHIEAPAPPPPPAPDPAPHAITSLPLPPDEAPAPVAVANVVAPQPAPAPVVAAPALRSVSRIHPIILPAPRDTPAVLIASGTISAVPAEPAVFTRTLLISPRPPPVVVRSPAIRAVAAPAPAPYVLPGHALPLDEELNLINGLNQAPQPHHRIPHFFDWIGLQIARPFKAFAHSFME